MLCLHNNKIHLKDDTFQTLASCKAEENRAGRPSEDQELRVGRFSVQVGAEQSSSSDTTVSATLGSATSCATAPDISATFGAQCEDSCAHTTPQKTEDNLGSNIEMPLTSCTPLAAFGAARKFRVPTRFNHASSRGGAIPVQQSSGAVVKGTAGSMTTPTGGSNSTEVTHPAAAANMSNAPRIKAFKMPRRANSGLPLHEQALRSPQNVLCERDGPRKEYPAVLESRIMPSKAKVLLRSTSKSSSSSRSVTETRRATSRPSGSTVPFKTPPDSDAMPPFRLRLSSDESGRSSYSTSAMTSSCLVREKPHDQELEAGEDIADGRQLSPASSTTKGPCGDAQWSTRRAWIPDAFPDIITYRRMFLLAMQVRHDDSYILLCRMRC